MLHLVASMSNDKEFAKGVGNDMIQLAIAECRTQNKDFARLHVDANNIWLREWYERLGFKELSRDENDIEMVKEL